MSLHVVGYVLLDGEAPSRVFNDEHVDHESFAAVGLQIGADRSKHALPGRRSRRTGQQIARTPRIDGWR
jgi:hypothetical protein